MANSADQEASYSGSTMFAKAGHIRIKIFRRSIQCGQNTLAEKFGSVLYLLIIFIYNNKCHSKFYFVIFQKKEKKEKNFM